MSQNIKNVISFEEDGWGQWWDEIKVADAHLDLAFDLAEKRSYGRRRILETDYLEDFRKSHVCLVISSIYIENQYLPEMGLRQALFQVEALLSDVEESSGNFKIIRNTCDLEQCLREEKIGIVISFEGIEPIHRDLNLLSIFWRLGVRGVGVCWSRRNEAADGSYFEEVPLQRYGGLTKFGRELIQYIEEKKFYLDLAHMNDEGIEEALALSQCLPMFSHVNCRTLNCTMRNATDEQLQKIIYRKGFIGVNAMNFTVSNGIQPTQDIPGYCDHIDYIMELGGENHVGFGFDFNDQILKYIPKAQIDLLPRQPFDCVKGYGHIEGVLKELKRRRYSKEQLQKIACKNLIEYLKKVLP